MTDRRTTPPPPTPVIHTAVQSLSGTPSANGTATVKRTTTTNIRVEQAYRATGRPQYEAATP
ncbi:hypothetical protein [Streptomyces sp. NPDC004579]|uniref:hypothetical protein n=1 Tax=Streptomyces sp. NPDC004579 TaxID=3154667 RepID=UPI0033BEDA20